MTSAMASDVVDNATVDRGGNNDLLTHNGGEIKATTTAAAETKQNNATPNLINSNSNSSSASTSKIPYPLATMLIGKTNQFRRSASTRLRETKTNLLFLPQRMANNNNNTPQSQFTAAAMNEMQMDKEKETNINTTTHTSLINEKRTQDCQSTFDGVLCINNDTTSNNAGNRPISTRRKLTLHSLSPAIRSLSLNSTRNDTTISGNYNSSKQTLKKTDSLDSEINRSKGFSVLEQKCVVKKSNQNGDISVKLPETKFSSTQSQQRGNLKKIMNEELSSTPSPPPLPGPLLPQQPTRKRDPNKMSLNLNGSTTTNRPVAVTTISNTSATTNFSLSAPTPPTVNARTPKTPIYKQPLETVPETKLTPKTPPVTPDSPSTYLEDDLDSLYSFATTTSGRSTMSCDHPYVARNGTTFSGRKMKYVVHCSNYAGQVGEDYLTPTQRAQRQIRRLRELLCSARNDLEQKDSEILRLTREVVELRLFKASLSSPEDRSNSSDAVTVREAELKTSQDVSPIIDMVDDGMKSSTLHYVAGSGDGDQHQNQHHLHLQDHHNLHSSEMQSSFADSGHFEDMTTSSVHSKDSSFAVNTNDMACGSDEGCDESPNNLDTFKEQRQELIRMYEQRIEELIKTQDSACSDMKRTHNDRVEALLQKLAECNTRYADIVPDYEHAKERIRELEKQLDDLQRKLFEHEEKQNKMYLHMYQKGQEAERISRADQALELAHRTPNKVSISELLHQLQSTQDELENIRTIYRRLLDAQKNKTHVDPEVTLQFLKSAVYYFLTDKENSQGHLQAIESILEFTEAEKQDISKARSNK